MAALLVVFLLGLTVYCAAQRPENVLSWQKASDPKALCNDYTRAGFFLNRNSNSSKWVIFLESGSLCYSNDTCNRRFFNETIREEANSNDPGISTDFPYGKFETRTTYNNVRDQLFVNPLMTSMECLQSRFPHNNSVLGRDIMDGDPAKNPDFYDHNHVIIPYCSSDLWLGEEDQQLECNCSDLACFNYTADSANLQFTFRGKAIFQSIFRQLQAEYGMRDAVEVVISGSSAGGVGVVNHAQWVRDQLRPQTELLVLFDSSWFVNFQDSIYKIFDGTVNARGPKMLTRDDFRLLDILTSHPACADFKFGYPCCISAHCVLTRRNDTGKLLYYPEVNQRTFALFSLYDIFLLAPALAGQDRFATSDNESPDGDDGENLAGQLINFLRIIGEYGGEMNNTVSRTSFEVPFLSYYSTQCFQHVYLATSDLWGSILFSNAEESSELASFTHDISSGRWSNNRLSTNSSLVPVTIQEAVSEWYHSNETKRFTSTCQGPYCTGECPDSFIIIPLTSNNWPGLVKFLIIAVSFTISMACIFMKMLFVLWLFKLERKQLAYLNSLKDPENGKASKLQLLECDDKDKMSVSCLDLTYSITYKISKVIKDESKDETELVALDIPIEELADEEDEKHEPPKRNTFERIRRTVRFPSGVKNPQKISQPHKPLLEAIDEDEAAPQTKAKSVKNGGEENEIIVKCFQEYTTKDILKGISLYFNPGTMIGIMGPSGCGKTTFLDILTGRRTGGKFMGGIYVNGFALDEAREWYIGNTGYVLQLAAPYYAQLTVRDNLTLSAQIMLGRNVSMKDKFKRVELVMNVTGLNKLANTVVGGDVGPGLSGGQKRRLAVAIQLLKMPSIIYLDEPTSGLDATASMELLYHLDLLAKSGRTVILTIHQPRMEIFHMFDRLVLLSDGKVAYHGAPEKAYEVFVSALLTKKLNLSSLKEQNPADVIMDILGQPKLRKTILEYYEHSAEPNKVRRAVLFGINKEESNRGLIKTALFGVKRSTESSSSPFVRMAALEARAVKRLSFGALAFLPAMFLLMAFILGTLYFQRTNPYLIVPAIATFSCASGLYVFPAIELYFTPAMRLFGHEKANGVGSIMDLVLQGFIRYSTIAFFPVLMSTSVIYLLLIKYEAYSLLVYLQVLAVNICLNLTWIALLTALLMTFSTVAFRISSVVSSIAGLVSGFLIPIGNIHWGYRWIAYLNPNYYALSSVTYFVLEDFNFCEGSQFECFFDSGPYILRMFFFDKINPYLHLVILLMFTALYLLLALLANWVSHTHVTGRFKRLQQKISERFDWMKKEKEEEFGGRQFKRARPAVQQSSKKSGWTRLKEALAREGSLSRIAGESYRERGLSFLSDDDNHKVWRPKFSLADIVKNMKEKSEEQTGSSIETPRAHSVTVPVERDKPTGETSLSVKSIQADYRRRRKKTLMKRVNFAWKVLQENPPKETASPKLVGKERWKAVARKVSREASHKKQADFSRIVADLVAKEKSKNS